MRTIFAVATSLVAISPLSAETITTYTAAPGQEMLAPEAYTPPFEGATTFNLDVGLGSAAFRDPAGPADSFYTVSDRGPNFTCGDLEDMMPVKAESACPEVEGMTVTKTERLVVSSLKGTPPRYPRKIEGLSLTADGKLLLINDNDFGIAGAPTEVIIVDAAEIGPR